jgi:hypothetical protein
MIIHQAVCPYHNAMSLTGVPDMIQVDHTVRIGEKYFQTAIASLNDVMGLMRDDQSW